MAAHGNVADQVDGLEHPCERLLLASLDIDLQQVDLFDAVLRYEMVQRDARDAMTPREFVRAFLIDHGFKTLRPIGRRCPRLGPELAVRKPRVTTE